MSNISYSTLYQRHLKGVEERRKTLIIAATSVDNSIHNNKSHDKDEINNMEEVELVNGTTQIEEELFSHSRLSPLLNYDPNIKCNRTNEESNEDDLNQQQLPQLLIKEATQIENTLLDFYKVTPTLEKLKGDFQEKKKEKQIEDNIQGSTGLALLAGSDSVTPRSSPKIGTPRLLVEKSLTNQTKFIVPTTYIVEELKNTIETTKNNCKLQDGIESPKKSLPKSLSSTQLLCKMPTTISFLNNSHIQNSTLQALNNVSLDSAIDTTRSSSSENETIEKDIKLKHKSFVSSSYIDEENSFKSIPPKTPRKNFKPDSIDDERIKNDLESRFLKHESNDSILESNNRDCKEWFREKLWCFLFETLSRAVDELYFLCDLQAATEKIDEAILFLDEAKQDFKELRTCVALSTTNEKKVDTFSNSKKCETNSIEEHKKKHDKIQIDEKKVEIQCSEKMERMEHKMKEFDTTVVNEETKTEIVGKTNATQDVLENSNTQSYKQNLYSCNIQKEPIAQNNERNIVATIETHIDDKNHDILVIGENFEMYEYVKELEIQINEMKLKIKEDKMKEDVSKEKEKIQNLCNNQIPRNSPKSQIPLTLSEVETPTISFDNQIVSKTSNEIPIDPSKDQISSILFESHVSTDPNTLISHNKNKKYLQSLSWEIPKRPPLPESDCRVGMIVNTAQSSKISQPQGTDPKTIFEEINGFEALMNRRQGFEIFRNKKEGYETYRDRREKNYYNENPQNRAASVIGYRVDEERQKMVEFENNDFHKQKSSKKSSQNVFTGRLMRPTESSQIRFATNIKFKEKEKSKCKKKHESWSCTTKLCYSNGLKQRESWLDALATPRRGPSRCQDFDKPQCARALDSIKKETIPQKVSKKSNEEKNSKKIAIDIPNGSQEKQNVELQIQKQDKSDYRLNQGKLNNKSMIDQVVQKKLIKNKVIHEYDIRHVEQRLAERLKQGANRRLACVEQIKGCVKLTNYEEEYNKSNSYNDFWQSNLNKTNNEELHVRFTGITFFQKQAMKKKVKNIRLKLSNKKVEFLEPPTGVEGAGIGSATAAGLAKSKIGKWMDEFRRIHITKETTTTISIVSEIAKCLERKDSELHIARQLGLVDFAATSIPLRQDPNTTLRLLEIQKILLHLPANRSYFIVRNLLPPMIPMLLSSLEIFSTFGNFYEEVISTSSNQEHTHESNTEKVQKTKELDVLQEILEGLLISTIFIMGHFCINDDQLSMQDDLADLLVASGLVYKLQNFFAIFDWRQSKQTPIPNSIVLSLKLMEVLTGSKRKSLIAAHEEPINILVHKSCTKEEQINKELEDSIKEESISGLASMDMDSYKDIMVEKCKRNIHNLQRETPRIVINQKTSSLAESTTLLLAAISETRLVGLPSLLIGIVLQVDPSLEETKNVLPSNFNEVAVILLQVLNNVARLDLSLVQNKLALPDVCMEFYQLVGFFLTYCTSNWKTTADEIATLLVETMMFIGYAALLHPQNQAILRWGKSPTILQKMCNLPFVFFSDSKLTPILIGTLLAICYGSEINRDVVQQQLSMEILLTFLKSSKTGLFQSSNSSSPNKKKEEIKDSSEKEKVKVTKGLKNNDEKDLHTPRSTQRMFLPNSLFGPSKSMLALEKHNTTSASPSTPKGTRRGEMNYCSTIRNSCFASVSSPHMQCSRSCRSLDSFDGTSVSSTNVLNRNITSPRMLNKNSDTNDVSNNEEIEPLPIAFALRNRFPEGLWSYAEEFFSSTTWMGQLVKCL